MFWGNLSFFFSLLLVVYDDAKSGPGKVEIARLHIYSKKSMKSQHFYKEFLIDKFHTLSNIKPVEYLHELYVLCIECG